MAQFQRAERNRNPTQFNGKGNCATTLQQLCIEKEGEDTKQLALHRNILSNGCEFFDRMLSGMFQALACSGSSNGNDLVPRSQCWHVERSPSEKRCDAETRVH